MTLGWLLAWVVALLVIAAHLPSRVVQLEPACDAANEVVLIPAVPAQIRVLSPDGELVGEWTASQYGLVRWTTGRERLLFLGPGMCGLALMSGSPEDGRSTALAYPDPFWGSELLPGRSLARVDTGGSATLVRLSGPVAESAPQLPDLENGVTLGVGQVYLGERPVATNLGQDFSVLWSPSRSWLALIARQPVQTRAMYRISTADSAWEWVRIVPVAEAVPDRAETSSPDGLWQISANGRNIVRTGTEPPRVRALWALNGEQAAVLDGEGIWLLDRHAPARLLVAGCCSLGLVNWTAAHLYYTVGRFGEGDN